MKIYQDLNIEGAPDKIAAFLDGFPDPGSGWTRNEEKSSRLPSYVAIDIPKRPDLSMGTVYLHWPDGSIVCQLANIIPVDEDLGTEAYNRIVNAFYTDC